MNDSMEQRVARIEAVTDIANLKARYCALCDDNYNPDGLASLFTASATWEGGVFGRHAGREAIRSFFAGISGEIVFAAHLVLNPIIEVTAPDRARGRWRLIMPATVIASGARQARWLFAAYDDSFVRENGTWLFDSLTVRVNFWGDAGEGWAATAVL